VQRSGSGRIELFPCSGKMMLGSCGNNDEQDQEFLDAVSNDCRATRSTFSICMSHRHVERERDGESCRNAQARENAVIGLVNSPAMATALAHSSPNITRAVHDQPPLLCKSLRKYP
jgi:hypothetical protein